MCAQYDAVDIKRGGSVLPSPPPLPDPAPSVPHQSPPLRVASFNVGQALSRKLPYILGWCSRENIHVIGLQEIGEHEPDRVVLASAGYCAWTSEYKSRGVAIVY